MPSFRRTIALLLAALLQVGMLPLWAQSRPGAPSATPECGCCMTLEVTACCCVGETQEPAADDCPCSVEHPAPAVPVLPSVPDCGWELLASAPQLAAPFRSTHSPPRSRAPHRGCQPVARSGPPLYRLYAVDRL